MTTLHGSAQNMYPIGCNQPSLIVAERPEELARPYLHEFMTAAYEHYDLVIWSATGMKWIEVKMRELGVSVNPAYKLTAFMDHKCMVTIQTARHGESGDPISHSMIGVVVRKAYQNLWQADACIFNVHYLASL